MIFRVYVYLPEGIAILFNILTIKYNLIYINGTTTIICLSKNINHNNSYKTHQWWSSNHTIHVQSISVYQRYGSLILIAYEWGIPSSSGDYEPTRWSQIWIGWIEVCVKWLLRMWMLKNLSTTNRSVCYSIFMWLVVSTPLENISQWKWLKSSNSIICQIRILCASNHEIRHKLNTRIIHYHPLLWDNNVG